MVGFALAPQRFPPCVSLRTCQSSPANTDMAKLPAAMFLFALLTANQISVTGAGPVCGAACRDVCLATADGLDLVQTAVSDELAKLIVDVVGSQAAGHVIGVACLGTGGFIGLLSEGMLNLLLAARLVLQAAEENPGLVFGQPSLSNMATKITCRALCAPYWWAPSL